MLKYMYIDESGDLGQNEGCSQYIVLSALLVDNPAPLDRIIKNMRRNRFKKQLKKAHEIKANKSSKEIIKYVLKKLNEIKNYKVFHVILEKKKLHSEFLKNNKHKLYNFVAGKLARNIILEGVDVEIRIDKSKGKQLLREDFNNYFERNLRDKSNIYKVRIFHSYSHSWSGLQFADILAWSAYQKVTFNNSEYIDLIDNQEVYQIW
ncbi:MAG: DUF3800 domain-containing protein [Candidatus Heimdallarchaeaceae archaeon]